MTTMTNQTNDLAAAIEKGMATLAPGAPTTPTRQPATRIARRTILTAPHGAPLPVITHDVTPGNIAAANLHNTTPADRAKDRTGIVRTRDGAALAARITGPTVADYLRAGRDRIAITAYTDDAFNIDHRHAAAPGPITIIVPNTRCRIRLVGPIDAFRVVIEDPTTGHTIDTTPQDNQP